MRNTKGQYTHQLSGKELVFTVTLLASMGYAMYVNQHPKFISPIAANQTRRFAVFAEERKQTEPTRADRLADFLKAQKSPLYPYASIMVREADRNGIDYTALTAISHIETTYGLHAKPDSHNAWSIMAWDKDGSRHIRMFASWEEGIKFTSELLGKNYRLNANKAIGAKYCPKSECNERWADVVTSTSKEILEGGEQK